MPQSCKKLCSLRVLGRAGVSRARILKVFLTKIRPVLEYAAPVWQSIPNYLADVMESVQKFPAEESYTEVARKKRRLML